MGIYTDIALVVGVVGYLYRYCTGYLWSMWYLSRWEESTSEPSAYVDHAPFSSVGGGDCHVGNSVSIAVSNDSHRRSKPTRNGDVGGWNPDRLSRELKIDFVYNLMVCTERMRAVVNIQAEGEIRCEGRQRVNPCHYCITGSPQRDCGTDRPQRKSERQSHSQSSRRAAWAGGKGLIN